MTRLSIAAGAVLAATAAGAAGESASGSGSGSVEVALHRIALGELGGWIAVDVELGGSRGRWLLDTGASRHFIAPALAQRLGLEPGRARRADLPLGAIEGREVNLPALRVGGIEFANQTALVADLAGVFGPNAAELEGVLGVPVFDGVGLTLDLRRSTAVWAPTPADACPAGLDAVGLKRYRGLPVVQLAAEGRAEALVLDTGNPAGLIRIVPETPLGDAAGIPLPGGQHLSVLARASLGPHVRSDVPVVQLVAPALSRTLSAGGVRGLLGMAWLDGARWHLDLGRGRLCVEAVARSVPGGFGLTLVRRGEELTIGIVLPGSPAERAGLRAGEVVSRWAGLPSTTALPVLWQAVQGRDAVELETGDPSRARTLTLTRAIFAPRAAGP